MARASGFAAATLFAAALSIAAPAPAADSIVLGAAVSLTGKYSTNGKNTKDGYDLAVQRVNEMGGVKVGGKTYQLKVMYYDDESTSARGAQLVERLINQDGVKFILGPYSSRADQGDRAGDGEIPHADGRRQRRRSRSLFTKGYKYTFRRAHTSDHYSARGDQSRRRRGAEGRQGSEGRCKVAIAVENDNFSQDVRDGIAEDAKQVRHADRHRRQAAADAQRHVGDADQGQGPEARPPRRLRPREGRRDWPCARSPSNASTCRCWR